MYQFIEITEGGQATSLGLQTLFDGINLDEILTNQYGTFKTLNVTGRAIVDRQVSAIDQGRHGARERSVTLEPRTISVHFRLCSDSNENFREAFNELNRVLIGSQKELSFTDEEAFFYATLKSFDNPTEDTNDLIGVLEFVCNDPFKYSLEKQLTTPYIGRIEGHEPTTWRVYTEFEENATGYEFQFARIGNSVLKDINKIVINGSFKRGDKIEIYFSKRRIFLNNRDISNQLVIMESNYINLPIEEEIEFQASNKTTVFYHERFF